MTASAKVPLKTLKASWNGTPIDLLSDTIKAMWVVAGSGLPSTNKTGVNFVSDVTGTNAEVTGGTYARKTLASKTWAVDGTASDQVDFGFANLTWSQDASGPTGMVYLVLLKDAGGADSANPVIAVIDPAATYSMVTGDVVAASPAGGTIQGKNT